jgi:hypothetical protein
VSEEQADRRGPYGVIYRRLWSRADFRGLSFEARALYCDLRTCPAGGLVGIFRFHPDDAHEDLGMGQDAIGRALDELEQGGEWIRRDGRWLWIVNAFATTPNVTLSNEKHAVAVEKALVQVSSRLADEFRCVYYSPDRLSDSYPDSPSDSHARAHPDGYLNHVDVNGDGDADGRIHKEEGKESDAVDRRLALLQRQAREIAADDGAPLRKGA